MGYGVGITRGCGLASDGRTDLRTLLVARVTLGLMFECLGHVRLDDLGSSRF